MHPKPVILILTAVHPDGLADLLGVLALGGELRNVLNDQEGAGGRGDTPAYRVESAGEDVLFTSAVVGEESVGRLRVGSVLASQKDAATHRPGHLIEQRAQKVAQSFVGKAAAGQFIVDPCV